MEIVKEYLKSETVRGLSKETIYLRGQLLKPYFQYLDERFIPFDRVGRDEAEEYLQWIQDKKNSSTPYSRGSLGNFKKTVKAFYRYLERCGKVYSNPFYATQKSGKEKKVLRHVLKEKEMKLLLDRLKCFYLGEKQEKLNRYIAHVSCELLYSTGMRIGELSDLLIYDINLRGKEILLRKTKNGHIRKVYLNEYVSGVLDLYLKKIRPLLVSLDDQSLFGKSKGALKDSLYRTLEICCSEAGLKKISCHGFRHAFGFHFLTCGCELRYIQKLLGHQAIGSTAIYTQVEKEDLKRVLDTYHPRGK